MLPVMPAKLLYEVAVRTKEDENAIAVSCDWTNEPPIPTAIILTPADFSDPAALATSSVELPAIRTTKTRAFPPASPSNSADLHCERAAPAVQLPPMSVTLEHAESTSEIEVYWLNPKTT